MELRHLKTFQVAADLLHFTKAAERLNFSQPAVSAQIHSLERELKQQLFFRIGKQTYLTPAGELLKSYTDRLFLIIEQMEESFSMLAKPNGQLLIAASEIYCANYLIPIVSEYLKQHPEVDIHILSRSNNEVIAGIENNQYDVGIIAGEITRKSITNILLEEEELVLVCGVTLYQRYTPEELMKRVPFFKYRTDGYYQTMMQEFLSRSGYSPEKTVEVESEKAIKAAVLQEMGVALLSSNLVDEEIEKGMLVPIQGANDTIQVKTSLIAPAHKKDTVTIKTFIRTIELLWNRI